LSLEAVLEHIAEIVAATALPVILLMSTNTGLGVTDLAELGVRRISVGSAP
jgi:2-methylisocitrate lyase-like PEP mutase family enzyme